MPRQPGSDHWADDDLLTHADWCDIYFRVNSLITVPDGECPTLDILDCPEAPHIWKKTDITEVRDKLDEICEENETAWTDYEEDQLWTTTLLNEIEDAIAAGWCNCCWDCPNARYLPFIRGPGSPGDLWQTPWEDPWTYLTTTISPTISNVTNNPDRVDNSPCSPGQRCYENTLINNFDLDGLEASREQIRAEVIATYATALAAHNDWNDNVLLEAGWEKVKQQAEDELTQAEATLAELEQIRDEICEEAQTDPGRQPACDAAEEAVQEQQDEVDTIIDLKAQIDAEYLRLEDLTTDSWDLLVEESAANWAAAASYPPYPGCEDNFTNLVPHTVPLDERWDRSKVGWREDCETPCGPKPEDLEEWVALIPLSDTTCWSPEPNQCRTAWNLTSSEGLPPSGRHYGRCDWYVANGAPILQRVGVSDPTCQAIESMPTVPSYPSLRERYTLNGVLHNTGLDGCGGIGNDHLGAPPERAPLLHYFRELNYVAEECDIPYDERPPDLPWPPHYYRPPCDE